MSKQNDTLFEESSQGSVSAVTAIGFVLSAVLLFGGILLSSYAFGVDGPHLTIFSLGLVASFLGLMLPFTFMPAIGK